MRRAVVMGSAMGSFAVEKFSNERLLEIDHARTSSARAGVPQLVAFDAELRTVT